MEPTIPNNQNFSLAIAPSFKVDRQAGVLRDLVLMQGNRESKGWGFWIDQKTLETYLAAIQQRGGRQKSYRTHDHRGPNSAWSGEDGSELDIPGYFAGHAIKGDELVAATFTFYDTFKKYHEAHYEQIMEMAEKTPDLISLSAEVWGYLVFVGEDGTEYQQRPEDVDLKYDGRPALRVTDAWAAAFVSDGAATEGLFAKLGALFGGKPRRGVSAAAAQSLAAAIQQWAREHGEAPSVPPAAPITEPSDFSATMKIIETIKAKFGANAAKFSQAMTLLGNKPDITIEALEAEMVQQDLSAAQASLATVTQERDTLRTQLSAKDTELATAKAEAADYKAKFEAIKQSGHLPGGAPGVDLGTPSAGAADTDNPWLPASFNVSRQIELMRTNPLLAAQLQQAAAAARAGKN